MMRLPQEVIDVEVAGPGVPQSPLREVVDRRPTLLVFLRHFG